MRIPAVLLVGLAIVGVVACGEAEVVTEITAVTIAGVGELPGPVQPVDTPRPNADAPVPEAATAVRPADLGLPSLGELVGGNRAIIIGDSILASTAPRFSGSMCERLNEAGWDVEINAEPGRFIAFAEDVLDARLAPENGLDWDLAVMFFGSNFNGSPSNFRSTLESLLERLSPRPVLLLTVTEFQQNRIEVNAIIREVADEASNVQVLDWARISAMEPGLLNSDGLHLSAAGKNRITTETVLALGTSPTLVSNGEGDCLPTLFTEDETRAAQEAKE
jgi:lysophospholipase L1-like esterase